ncbi:hypothetical protein [Metabacillus sp. 84]|uniref:hypothetical protein n=1 Tax=unclassified Metabacillus TaxID=2675274 RepID=UPI003CF8B3D1
MSEQTFENLEEASMNFDIEYVTLFLKRIVLLIESGFSETECKQVQNRLERMEHDEELEVGRFDIVYQKQKTTLIINAFMDSPESPDIYIYTKPGFAGRIQEEMSRFADEIEDGY